MKTDNRKFKIIKSIVILIFSVTILTTAVFGWFIISQSPDISPFVITVTSVASQVNYNIEGLTENDTLLLENAAPGKEYKFTLEITNLSENTAILELYFRGFTSPVLETYNGQQIYIDMCDVFKLNFKDSQGDLTSSQYLRDLLTETKVPIISSYQMAANEVKNVEFFLEFATSCTYKNSENEYITGNVNAFQGKNFNISSLVIELY